MAVKLNLLPSDYSVSKPVAAVLKFVRPLNVILLGIFLTAALGMAGFFIFSSVSLKNLNTANNTLKSQIQAQQEAQQQVVLLKDRLGKIKRIAEVPSSIQNYNTMVPFLNSISENDTITEFEVTPPKIALTVAFKTNSTLTNFMRSLDTQSPFATITLDSFNYNPTTGYSVGMSYTVKK